MKRCAILAGLVLFASGCGDETLHSPFLVRVSQINGGTPLLADVMVVVDAEAVPPAPCCAIPADIVVVRIENRPYNDVSVTDPNTFTNAFQVTGCTVTWRRVDEGPTSGPGWTLSDFDLEQATTTIVPANGFAEFGVLIPAGMRTVDPFVQALGGAYIQTIADFDIVGAFVHDPTREIHLTASLAVDFADFADEEQ
jgi:hypothetical protein